MTDDKVNPEDEVTRPPAETSPEMVPVTEDLYSDMTLEELEQRLELQALLDGDLGADSCYILITCGGQDCGTQTIVTTVTVTRTETLPEP